MYQHMDTKHFISQGKYFIMDLGRQSCTYTHKDDGLPVIDETVIYK